MKNMPLPLITRRKLLSLAGASLALHGRAVAASSAPGIKLGQTMPYSGPASVLSAIGRVQTRFFRMVSDKGGIDGRPVTLLSVDDGYNPAKAIEQTRYLVEREGVVAMFGSMGTAQNAAVEKYLNTRKIPQLFVYAGSDRFADPKDYPWTLPGMTTFSTEAGIYADFVNKVKPETKVAVLYQYDDFGKEYLDAFRARLRDIGSKVTIAGAAAYEVTSPSINSQLITLAGTGADVFMNITTPKFTVQAIRKVADLGWRPLHIVPITSNFVPTVLKVAGLEKCVGLISATPSKSVDDAEWADDPAYREWLAFMAKYYPEGDVTDELNLVGYGMGVLMVDVLRRCDDEITPDRIIKEATSLQDVSLPSMLPGILVGTTPSDYHVIKQLRMQRFDGSRWVLLA